MILAADLIVKDADFVILNKDVLSIDTFEIYSTKVYQTYINGKLIFEG